MRTLSVLAAGTLLLAGIPAVAQGWVELRDAQFGSTAELFASNGYHPVGFIREGALANGGEERVAISLVADRQIMLTGICDLDCDDLDMTLLDANGHEVATDQTNDDVPVINTTPTRSGKYTVSVRMVTCTREPCRYAVQLASR